MDNTQQSRNKVNSKEIRRRNGEGGWENEIMKRTNEIGLILD
jgi:hypothetical protein